MLLFAVACACAGLYVYDHTWRVPLLAVDDFRPAATMPVPRMGELWMKPGMPTLKEVERAQREDEECRAMMDYLSKQGWERNARKECQW